MAAPQDSLSRAAAASSWADTPQTLIRSANHRSSHHVHYHPSAEPAPGTAGPGEEGRLSDAEQNGGQTPNTGKHPNYSENNLNAPGRHRNAAGAPSNKQQAKNP